MAMNLGLRAEFSYRVTAADTAAQLGSGDVAVLGTPRVLALMERTGRRITCTARMSAGERTLATANIVRVVVNRATSEAGTG
jgi:fluoroacetyl-CoA thioesterase